jgi:hypothetical protein
MTKLKVYVGCALTHVPVEERKYFTLLLNEVKNLLTKSEFEVLDFLSAVEENPTPEKVYTFDIACLEEADCMLALGDYPGTGLGYELCYTTELKVIPTMVGITSEKNLSKLLLGVSHKNYTFKIFKTPVELVASFTNFVNTFYEKNN